MRLGIKAKQIAGVTAIVGLAIVALSAINLTRLARVVLHESHARGQLLGKAIFHRAREVVTTPDAYTAMRHDTGLRSILEASIYGESIVDAVITDANAVIVAASDKTQEGQKRQPREDLDVLLSASAWEQLKVIYSREGQILEVRQPMSLGDQAFGSIGIGVSTLLMRKELTSSLQPAFYAAIIALVVSVLVAGVLAQLVLRPIHVLRSGLTRLGKGEFGVTLDLPPGDEFAELGAFFNNVSQQLSADRSLLAGQKANLQSAVEHLEDAVALFNPTGELLFSNPAMQPVLPADAIGRSLRGLLPVGHPYTQIVEETLGTRRSRGPIQARLETSDDELLVMTHAVEGTGGELVGVLLVARNLAYLTRMQSTLAYSRKLVALGRLTAGIAHEVKNPLNAMMIHLELLRTKLRAAARQMVQVEPVGAPAAPTGGALAVARREQPAPVIAQGALEHVEIIENEIRRLDEVVQGFLKFTRPEDLRLQPVRPRALFDEILPVVEPEAQRHAVTIHVDVSPHAPAINGDPGMLRQVFLNLAINACQAMPTGGGTLRLTAGAASRGRVELRVQDTGVGIPPENLQKIFDLYFTTKDHGTGIGLSMVYRIVQLHDGEIEVQSTPGRGTTFRVLLPRANEIEGSPSR